MPLRAEVGDFLEVATAALPRITEIIFAFPPEHARVLWKWQNTVTGERRGILVVPKLIQSDLP
jgi:hypothetical protein